MKFTHGIAHCIKDIEHEFPHGKIKREENYAISAWLPEEDITCILLPNPKDPGIFFFRMTLKYFNEYFERIEDE